MKIEKLFIRIGGKNSEKTNISFIIFIYIFYFTNFFNLLLARNLDHAGP